MPRRRHAVTALLGAGLLLTAGLAPAASAVPATPAAPPAVRINAGGPALTDAQGVRWAADSLYAGGSTAAVTRTLTGTSTPALLQDVRWKMSSYRVPLPVAGTYDVTLGFAETAFRADGRRVFSVTAEGTSFVEDLDVHAAVGRDRAHTVTRTVAVRDGALDLGFTATKDNAFLASLEVVPKVMDPVDTPPALGSQFHCMWSGASGYGSYTFDATRAAVLDKLAAAGVRAVRIDVGWDGLQPSSSALPAESSWYVKLLDGCVAGARARGMDVMLTLDRAPSWARPAAYKSTARVLPADPRSIAPVSGWLASRYGGQVSAIEVWNEPNLRDFVQVVDPAAYVRVLKAAHGAIKAADPRVKVVFSGADRVAVSPGASAVDDFYSLAYKAGAHGAFDVMAVHTYQGPADAPHDAPDAGTWRITHMPHLLSLMASNGDGSVPVWVTEFGWSVHANAAGAKPWDMGVTADQQARYTVGALDLMARWPQVTQAYVYAERQKATGNVHQDGFGLLNRDLSPRPVYLALAARAKAATAPTPVTTPVTAPVTTSPPAPAPPTPSGLCPA